MKKADIWQKVLLILSVIFTLAGTITSSCHMWDKPYNFVMFKYLTWVDWTLLGIGLVSNIAMQIVAYYNTPESER